VVIAPQFEQADGFSEGLAQVRRNGEIAFVDRLGRVVLRLAVDRAGAVRAGVLEVWVAENNGWLDRQGHWLIDPGQDLLAPQ